MDRQAGFNQAKNYALYYGLGRARELAHFDLVIVEPDGHNAASLRVMQDAGTLVLAYLSVMEIPPAAPENKLLRTTDYLSNEGSLLSNVEYGNYLADLRSTRWVGLLLQKAGRLIQSGYDGLFLDTIGDVESTSIPGELRDLQLMAAVNIVGQLRRRFPQHILVQNSGLEKLCSLTAAYINGICWENPPLGIEACIPWVEVITGKLEKLRDTYGIKVLLLQEEKDEAGLGGVGDNTDAIFQLAKDISHSKDFLLYKAPYRYIGGINT